MSAPIGARQDGCFKAVSMAPSFNLTPVGPAMPPLPYPTVSDLAGSVGVAKSVRFNGKPVYTMASSQPDCKGDEQGSGGGVRSGTVNGAVKPTSASTSVKVEGKRVVRDGDTCTMNGGNNIGMYVTVPAPSPTPPAMAAATSNPPVKPETPQEKSSLRRWLDELRQEVQQAAAQPLEGLKGAVKGVINIPSDTVELLAKAAVEQHATELADAAITATSLGQAGTAKSLTELAGASREQGARIDVPKLGMNNQAQQGGDVIAAAVGVFAGGVGLARAGVKAIGKMGEIAEVRIGGGLTLSPASSKTTSSSANGIRIVGFARIDKKIEKARQRQIEMLHRNVGYNISPSAWDAYPTIGQNGTFVSDAEGVLGYFKTSEAEKNMVISSKDAAKIENDMGLVPGTLQGGFKVREVTGIQDMAARSPLEGNHLFLGPGNHLPSGAPEMVVDSVPTLDNESVRTILNVKVNPP